MKPVLRLLVVEDSEFDAQMVTSLIRKSGMDVISERVETAEQMEKALHSKPWDIILSDYNLPTFSAPEALKILQHSELDVPFIIIATSPGCLPPSIGSCAKLRSAASGARPGTICARAKCVTACSGNPRLMPSCSWMLKAKSTS
jgi:CheY-like chemotaxis protein